MLYKAQCIYRNRVFTEILWGFPYISLLLWTLPLLLFNSGQDSLMAHDEGLYAWRSRFMVESGDWIHPWSTPHHKTPGPYWLIASAYTLFGINETSVRLPSAMAGILSVLLLYEIGRILLGKKVGWLAAAILSVEFLWLQYSRLGTPDVPMIFLVLLAIWSFLKAELHPRYRFFWSFLAGLSFGLGFLVRSFMIVLPIVALLPYLIWEHRRHRHLTNPMLYLGFVVGLIPTGIWLWLNFHHYGKNGFAELINFVMKLSSGDRNNNGLEFYFWNLPVRAFPWFFVSLLGLGVVLRRPIPRYHLLLIGFPLTLFVELTLFPTRLPHYSLTLYPFIALLGAVGLNWLGRGYTNFRLVMETDKGTRRQNTQGIPHSLTPSSLARNLSYAFGGLGVVLSVAGVVAFTIGDAEVRKYATMGLVLGIGWLILLAIWIARYHYDQKFLTVRYWIAGWLIPAWLTLAVAGSTGIIGDYNPDLKAFIHQPEIAQVLSSSPVYFVQIGGKTGVLLNFYTPHHGQKVQQVSELPAASYAWIPAKKMTLVSQPYRLVGTVQKVNLIQLLNNDKLKEK
ncbi:phospholipid carrier-dependent glycosyltransferase [Scytonema sp. UIC 10036]|uniref:ArnT family glycosyltransferase n=1 Tax=Scytonema sp. UIC 10036 TaxID=2304196 RepID=UPI0012DABBEA|nr:glycosyltransferase family 39 protein [Scytonema sp. UIC 10036]MUG95426.1 phospholipid carrier-dependent glycosyltransferase [Scytonema sp. UIC 10036]